MSASYVERVILGEERGAMSWAIRAALWPFSMIYGIGLAIFLGLYDIGIRKRHRLGVPVISVGNLTFGGTGKTPAVQKICRILKDSGLRAVILSRGHGGSRKGVGVVSDGEKVLMRASDAGDEPVMLARSLLGVPVLVGKDRRQSGELAVRSFNPDVIVLDDGLQYWQLHRDLDIIVMSAARPFGSGFVMPMGDLRGPVSGLRRAGVVLLNTGGAIDVESTEQCVKKLVGHSQVFRCAHRPERFVRSSDGKSLDLDLVKNRRVLAFCGIGRPNSFFDMLESLAAHVVKQIAFSDHHRYADGDIQLIGKERIENEAELVVTTDKDISRLEGQLVFHDLYSLAITLDIEEISKFAESINIQNRQASSPKATD